MIPKLVVQLVTDDGVMIWYHVSKVVTHSLQYIIL